MKSQAACYRELRDALEQMPIVDCHDHTGACGPKYKDAITAVVNGYFPSDVQSATSDQDVAAILDEAKPVEERWPLLERAWKRTCHTGYAQVTRRVMQHFYGEECAHAGGAAADAGQAARSGGRGDLHAHPGRGAHRRPGGRCWPDVKEVVEGNSSPAHAAAGHLAAGLPRGLQLYPGAAPRGATGRTVTSLDEYLDACRRIFEAHKVAGR